MVTGKQCTSQEISASNLIGLVAIWAILVTPDVSVILQYNPKQVPAEYTMFLLFYDNWRKKQNKTKKKKKKKKKKLSRTDKWFDTLYRKYQTRSFYEYLFK